MKKSQNESQSESEYFGIVSFGFMSLHLSFSPIENRQSKI
jgi:hypothetical protein